MMLFFLISLPPSFSKIFIMIGRITSMINQQWLHTFLSLAEVGHFTQTAEKLSMTQPGVSQQIKKLEEQVEAFLLNRIGKRFELIREGEILYQFGFKRRREEDLHARELQIRPLQYGHQLNKF